MESFDRHVLICDPQPSGAELDEWRAVTKGIAASIMRVNSPRGLFAIGNDLQHIVENRAAGSGPLGTHVARAMAGSKSQRDRREDALYSSVCAMLAVREVLAGGGDTKRGVAAVATWSALSFGAPLLELRLEALRKELLVRAREKSLQMASLARQRLQGPTSHTSSPSPALLKRQLAETNKAWRRNAALDHEAIALLRWLLADKCLGLGCGFGDIGVPETAALAMGMELGRMLTIFPTGAHYRLGPHFVKQSRSLDLRQLIDAVGADRRRLAELGPDQSVAEAWPAVFPLMSALAGGSVQDGGARIGRSLTEWWERAVLERAAAALASRKGWS